jgi:hypothetical protein
MHSVGAVTWTIVLAGVVSGMSTTQSQNVHAHARSSGCSFPDLREAVLQDLPASLLTSTRTIPLPPPLYAYPWMRFGPGLNIEPVLGVMIADCTGCSCREGIASTSIPSSVLVDGPNPLYAIPRCHGPCASSAESLMSVSHLTFLTPT